jgi:hypothetical protein
VFILSHPCSARGTTLGGVRTKLWPEPKEMTGSAAPAGSNSGRLDSRYSQRHCRQRPIEQSEVSSTATARGRELDLSRDLGEPLVARGLPRRAGHLSCAGELGAPHERERLFVLAHADARRGGSATCPWRAEGTAAWPATFGPSNAGSRYAQSGGRRVSARTKSKMVGWDGLNRRYQEFQTRPHHHILRHMICCYTL